MKAVHRHWHVYRREQIRAELRGKLVYALEVPTAPGLPVVRHVFDPTGREFPGHECEPLALVLAGSHHGIIYEGVNKAAVYDIMLSDPSILKWDSAFVRYNRRIVTSSREFFLRDPGLGLDVAVEATVRLLCGETEPSGIIG